MEFKVKKLANFTMNAHGVFSKKFWLQKGKTEAEADKRVEQRKIVFTIQDGKLIGQQETGDNYVPLNPGFHYDPDTLRNIAQLANSIADSMEEDLKDKEKVA